MASGTGFPGMRPGETVRNVAVALAALLIVAFLLGSTSIYGSNVPTAGATPTAGSPTGAVTVTPGEAGPTVVGGSGSGHSNTFSLSGGLAVFNLSHDGSGQFKVDLETTSGTRVAALVNSRDRYDGEVATRLAQGEYVLNVTARDSWRGEIAEPRFAVTDVRDPPVAKTDGYHGWVGPIDFSGNVTVTVTTSSSAFVGAWIATLQGDRVQRLVTQPGPYQERVIVDRNANGIVIVETELGNWTVAVREG